MSLASRLSMAPPNAAGQFCQVGRLLVDKLNDEDVAVLRKVLSDRQWPSTAIQRVLQDEGHRVSERHLREHRRGDHSSKSCLAPTVGVVR